MSLDVQETLLDFFNVSYLGKEKVLSCRKDAPSFVVYDPGLYHTAICKSSLCEIDKEDGSLYYRGVDAITLLDHDFLDIAFFLVFGSKDSSDRELFRQCIHKHFRLYEEQKQILDAIGFTCHPMSVLAMMTTSLQAIEGKYVSDLSSVVEKAAFIIAQVAITVAYRHTKQNGLFWVSPETSEGLPYATRILFQMHAGKNLERLKQLGKILNTIMILHAEHGQNCSASAVRTIASARGCIYASIAGGMSAFNGSIHGGASQYVSCMYEEISQGSLSVSEYVENKMRNKQLLMGFGQRTYNRIKNCWDPRVETMMKILTDPGFVYPEVQVYKEIALKLIEKVAQEPYFLQKNLTPNPDLFNCIFFKLFGATKEMNTVMLGLGRISGWLANYVEHTQHQYPLTRPCDLYV